MLSLNVLIECIVLLLELPFLLVLLLLQLPELLGRAKDLGVRVDMWAFPTYTKIDLLRQASPGKGSWDRIAGYTFKGLGSAVALERSLLYIEARVTNFELRNELYSYWRNTGYRGEWEKLEAGHAHRYIVIPEPEGAS